MYTGCFQLMGYPSCLTTKCPVLLTCQSTMSSPFLPVNQPGIFHSLPVCQLGTLCFTISQQASPLSTQLIQFGQSALTQPTFPAPTLPRNHQGGLPFSPVSEGHHSLHHHSESSVLSSPALPGQLYPASWLQRVHFCPALWP